MSFGGFSDIQRDRDRAHSSRHRIARFEESGGEDRESYESERRRSPPRSEERPNREEGYGRDNEDPRRGGSYREFEEELGSRGSGGGGKGQYHASANDGDTDNRGGSRPEFRENNENTDRGNANGNPITWESAVETGINTFAKAYDKSASANRGEGAGENGNERRQGEPSAFAQRLAKREEGESVGDFAKQAFSGVKATIEKLTGERK